MTLTQALVQFPHLHQGFFGKGVCAHNEACRMIIENIEWDLGLSLLLQMLWCWYAADRLFD